jgi:hypothetical protein
VPVAASASPVFSEGLLQDVLVKRQIGDHAFEALVFLLKLSELSELGLCPGDSGIALGRRLRANGALSRVRVSGPVGADIQRKCKLPQARIALLILACAPFYVPIPHCDAHSSQLEMPHRAVLWIRETLTSQLGGTHPSSVPPIRASFILGIHG